MINRLRAINLDTWKLLRENKRLWLISSISTAILLSYFPIVFWAISGIETENQVECLGCGVLIVFFAVSTTLMYLALSPAISAIATYGFLYTVDNKTERSQSLHSLFKESAKFFLPAYILHFVTYMGIWVFLIVIDEITRYHYRGIILLTLIYFPVWLGLALKEFVLFEIISNKTSITRGIKLTIKRLKQNLLMKLAILFSLFVLFAILLTVFSILLFSNSQSIFFALLPLWLIFGLYNRVVMIAMNFDSPEKQESENPNEL